jgi:hypothetical protein
MKDIKKPAALMGLLLLCYPLAGQDARFSGRWTLNQEKTQIPNLPDIKIEISQSAGVIHYSKRANDSQNAWVTDMVLPADGRETTWTDWNGTRLKCSGVVRDETFILAYESRQMRSGKWVILEMRDELSVSADGKTLSIIHSETWGEGKGGTSARPMVFDRVSEDAGKVQDTKKSEDSGSYSKQQLIEDSRQLLSYLENIHPDPSSDFPGDDNAPGREDSIMIRRTF